MLSQYLAPSITKNVISSSLVLAQQRFIALGIQTFNKVFQFILKSIETFFLIQNYFYSNAKKYK